MKTLKVKVKSKNDLSETYGQELSSLLTNTINKFNEDRGFNPEVKIKIETRKQGCPNIRKFLKLLQKSSAIIVNDGPLLSSWHYSNPNGDPDNEIAHFSWLTEDEICGVKITEDGLKDALFVKNRTGTFLIQQATDSEGDSLEIRFYRLSGI